MLVRDDEEIKASGRRLDDILSDCLYELRFVRNMLQHPAIDQNMRASSFLYMRTVTRGRAKAGCP